MLRRERREWSGLVVLLVVGLLACRGPAEPGEVHDRVVERRLTLQVNGARSVAYDADRRMHILTRRGEREQVEFNVAAVELEEPIELDDGALVAIEVGLVGVFTGEGTYTAPKGIGLVTPMSGPTVTGAAVTGSESLTNISVLFYETGPGGEVVSEERFGYLLDECEVVLSEDATVGSVHCAALVAASGQQVSLDASWEE